jgi:hypothetical protein
VVVFCLYVFVQYIFRFSFETYIVPFFFLKNKPYYDQTFLIFWPKNIFLTIKLREGDMVMTLYSSLLCSALDCIVLYCVVQ